MFNERCSKSVFSKSVTKGCNGQDHDHSRSSSKSSDVSDEVKVDQMLTQSREGSPIEHENAKGSENLISPKAAANADKSNKPVETSTDLDGMHDSNSPSQSYMKKSATMSNGPAPRHRNMLGRTSVSNSFQN